MVFCYGYIKLVVMELGEGHWIFFKNNPVLKYLIYGDIRV